MFGSFWRSALLAILAVVFWSAPAAAKPPRLTLFISVDSLGSDLFQRMRPRFKGGFRQLLNNGAFYPDVRYPYTELVTAPGHATLATGASPWRHGIVSNRIFNRATGKLESIYADPNHPALEAPLSNEDSSPEALLTETLADRLRLTTSLRGKAFAVADKARAAIPFAGRLGQAFWFAPSVGRFVTGTYYLKESPAWLKELNQKKAIDAWFGKTWSLLAKPEEYWGDDDRAFELDENNLGRVFPHALTGGLTAPGPQYYRALATTPFLGETVVQIAKTLITQEQLGKDDVPDWLGVSFSHVDRTYHQFGPYSWEMQDALLRTDKALGDLLSAAEKAAGGRENLLVVLSADHGGGAIAEEWAATGMPGARFFPREGFAALNKELQTKFGAADLVVEFEELDIYLNNKVIADKKLDGAAIRRYVAAWFSKQPAVALAVARDDLDTPGYPQPELRETLRRGFHPDRSGDVLFIPKPFKIVSDEPGGASHGAPYAYDNQIPLVLYGHGIRAVTVPQTVQTIDVAPTVATLLEMGIPASSEGVSLPVPQSGR